jgi:hypothetical protein
MVALKSRMAAVMSLVFTTLLVVPGASGGPMRPVAELIDTRDPAWPLVKEWVAAAKNSVEILPAQRADGERTLHALQVTTRSPMGAIALASGGILVDHGWLRILGGGCARMTGSLASWNGLDGKPRDEPPPFLIVAHDVIGGFFAINGGGLPGKPGNVHYFAPDTLDWQDTGKGYTDFLRWAFLGDLEKFYGDHRWKGWEKDVATLHGDQGFSLYPPLWSREAKQGTTRKPASMKELWGVQMEMRQKLAKKK